MAAEIDSAGRSATRMGDEAELTDSTVRRVAQAFEDAVRLVDESKAGDAMMRMAERLFPLCRSITGDGVRETLRILSEKAPLHFHEVPTGYRAFDWAVPREWNIRDAYVKDETGRRVIDFRQSNLHVLNYSAPVRTRMTLDELRPHLHAREDSPEAIPYVTSYYEERWGFCLTWRSLQAMKPGLYEVVIDSSLKDGSLTYAEAVLPGDTSRELFFSTYFCHPSMANNELSGPLISTWLCALLKGMRLRYTYRFVFVPETIGSLVYLSKNGDQLKSQMDAGFVVTCAGDDGPFTYKRSRRGDTLADRAATHVLRHVAAEREVRVLDFFPSGSDERQYCSLGFDLPVGSLMRSMYGTYPEYHTSLDDLSFISAEGLAATLTAYLRLVQTLELNAAYVNTSPYGEPQLGKRGLYPTLGAGVSVGDSVKRMSYLLAYGDGAHDLIDIADRAGLPAWSFAPEIEKLMAHGLLTGPNS